MFLWIFAPKLTFWSTVDFFKSKVDFVDFSKKCKIVVKMEKKVLKKGWGKIRV
jgi:hypothetical protein